MTDKKLQILIIDDEPKDYHSFWARYNEVHDISLKNRPDEGITEAVLDKWDIILVDLNYGGGYEEGLGRVLPQVLKQVNGRCPVLVVTSDTRAYIPALVMELGASGLIRKREMANNTELLLKEIQQAISDHHGTGASALEKKTSEHLTKDAPDVATGKPNSPLPQSDFVFISASEAIEDLKIQLETAVNYPDVPVLILGETGVGKDLAAKYLHYKKGIAGLPLEIVNLSALNNELVASELFGHVKGAFTGANADKVGYFERVSNGVLFLDEIGEVSKEIQVQLLRVLENRTFQRVGDTNTLTLKAHLVFATNKSMSEAIENDEIREDFYQRISALTFTIPPLRERKEDILPLAQYFFDDKIPKGHPLMGKTLQEAFMPDALAKFYDYAWPGNVRELRSTMQRLVFDAHLKKKDIIDISLLPDRLTAVKRFARIIDENTNVQQVADTHDVTQWDVHKTAAYKELKLIETTLIKEGGRKVETAKALGFKNDQALRYKVQIKYYKNYPELFEEFQTIKKVYKLT